MMIDFNRGLAFGPTRDFCRLRLVLFQLWLRNKLSSEPAVGNAPVVVSLTSHGKRIQNLWYTLESIAHGQHRPARILVWLDASLGGEPLRPELVRLRERGVEFRFVEDIGPHQKYFYAIEEALAQNRSLATVDDDTIYWSWWLKTLVVAQDATPDAIVCYRARKFSFLDDGEPAPYSEWPLFVGDRPSPDLFFTGVSGVLYPAAFLRRLRRYGRAFEQVCPKADDVWLNYVASRTDTVARQVAPEPFGFPEVPQTQDIALWSDNAAGGNDYQIRATYDPETLAKINQDDVSRRKPSLSSPLSHGTLTL